MTNIILIGMPASGKSTIGIILAKTLGLDFLDTDLLIQKKEKMLLQDIIDSKGIQYFNSVENSILKNLKGENTVIATGGSAIYHEEGMENLQRLGLITYLNQSLKTIENRLKNIRTRGIAMKKNETIEALYKDRIPLYEKYANVTIECKNRSIEEVLAELIDKIKLY